MSSQSGYVFDATVRKPNFGSKIGTEQGELPFPILVVSNTTRVWKTGFWETVSHPQSGLDRLDRGDTVGAIGVSERGVLLAGIVAEQKHLLGVEGVFGPVYAR